MTWGGGAIIHKGTQRPELTEGGGGREVGKPLSEPGSQRG